MVLRPDREGGVLGVCLVATVVLLALRVDTLVSDKTDETVLAREGAFLLNNLLLVAFMFTVLIGTLFPIIAPPEVCAKYVL